jgi:hypothetical protein
MVLGMKRYEYNIDVIDAPGGADLNFTYPSARELVENDSIHDHLGRSYLVVSVGEETSPSPLDEDLIHGSAKARPAA